MSTATNPRLREDKVTVAGGDHRGKPSYYPSRLLQNDVVENAPDAVQSLPESRAGWHRIQAQRLSEEGVITEGLNGIEVGLAYTDLSLRRQG
ncbi:MAG: hypothetical protein DDT30_01877 [Dehalococcoidia bacterium]|nr:hypothetical protein [Bacillota bacterium]